MRRMYETALQSEGVEIIGKETYHDEILMSLRVPFERLCLAAERAKLEMPLKEVGAQ